MKKIVPAVFLIACAVALFAAQDPRPRVPGNPVYVSWLSGQPTFGPHGEIEKMVVSYEFSSVEMQPSGNVEVKVVGSAQVDLLLNSGTVVVGDTMYSDQEAVALFEAIGMREYAKHFPSPLPTRKTTRAK